MGEAKKGFKLPVGETVTVKFIKRSKGLAATVDDNHVISGGLLEGASRRFCVAPRRGGGLKNVLTSEEKDFFEGENGPYRGQDLSVYSKFWDDFYVKLGKTDTVLRLDNPIEYLKYKVLLGWDDVVAPSLEEYKRIGKLTYQFMVIKDGEERKDTDKKLSSIKSAWKAYNKIESNRSILISVISLIEGKKLSDNSDLDYIQGEVERIVDTRPADFVNLINDNNFEVKSLIALAEHAGVIIKKSGKYESIDGLKLAERDQNATLENTVKFLNSPKNQEVKDLITLRLENTKE